MEELNFAIGLSAHPKHILLEFERIRKLLLEGNSGIVLATLGATTDWVATIGANYVGGLSHLWAILLGRNSPP